MECVSLLLLYSVLLLSSFLRETKDPHLVARTRNSPETWDMTILSCPIFLHPLLLLAYPKKKGQVLTSVSIIQEKVLGYIDINQI